MTGTFPVVRDRAELAGLLAALPRPVALVPTMGALHAGHLALVQAARRAAAAVLVSIFVNPLQFGPAEDFERYPRPLEDDLRRCAAERVDGVFVPDVATVYAGGQPQVTVDPGPTGGELEGAVRPGHFAGVLTVVTKLLLLTGAGLAYFGEKDYQQLVLVRRAALDLDLPCRIVGVPTVREADGLALSSRNGYLGPADRVRARVLSAALFAGAEAAGAGPAAVLARAGEVLAGEPEVTVDYLVLRGPDLEPAPEHGTARLLVAARVGGTRLIDNVPVALPER